MEVERVGPPHPKMFFDWVQGQWEGAPRAERQLKGAVLVMSALRMFQLWDKK